MLLAGRYSMLAWPRFMAGIRIASVLFIALVSGMTAVHAADFVSVTENAVALYNEPYANAKKIYVVSRYMPLEQVVNLEKWVKVRDSSGGLAWIEKRYLSDKRFVVVTGSLAALRQSPEEKSSMIVQVKKQVALEWLENTDNGWLKVRHLDGATGYIKATEVWGD